MKYLPPHIQKTYKEVEFVCISISVSNEIFNQAYQFVGIFTLMPVLLSTALTVRLCWKIGLIYLNISLIFVDNKAYV